MMALQQMAAQLNPATKSEAIAINRALGSDIEMSTSPPRNESGSFEDSNPFAPTLSVSAPTLQLQPPLLQTQQSVQAQAAIDFEREIATLENAIRTQKESSMNAKTAITFDQLRLVHAIGKSLGNGKDAFYDRICRAADIQRASLKNRLKQNKEKFVQKSNADFPPGILALIRQYPPPAKYAHLLNPITTPFQPEKSAESAFDFLSANFDQSISTLTTPVGTAFLPQGGISYAALIKPEVIEASEPVICPVEKELQEREKIPAQRMMQLLQLGFTFDDLKMINEMYFSYSEMARRESVGNIREQFSNFLSTSIPERLKLIGIAYNMLEMGYSSTAIAPYLTAERRKRQTSEMSGGDDSNQGDQGGVKRPCLEDIDERT
ncbi:hypothetical protein PFISCL1PPCAC_8803 [Pristionchus fissidentatus]|uniref:Uncharacterized protein n=1 Tax=Pristionchus fissidentatus TaxID=1538716 RepID=A0AAV5VCT3_9BILA|nr:hypothetical protein PFISCL1PPCAC_8803 [Pristionchus fissidentatus]